MKDTCDKCGTEMSHSAWLETSINCRGGGSGSWKCTKCGHDKNMYYVPTPPYEAWRDGGKDPDNPCTS